MRASGHSLRIGVFFVLLVASSFLVWLIATGPARIEERAQRMFEREQRLLARQGAERIARVLMDVRRRIEDSAGQAAPELGAVQSTEDLEGALARLVRPGDGALGISLFAHDAEGRILATPAGLAVDKRAHFAAHRHKGEADWGETVHVCEHCLEDMGAVTISTAVGDGRYLAANVDAGVLARATLEGLYSVEGGGAALVGAEGRVLYATGAWPAVKGEVVQAEATLDEAGVPWRVRVGVPRAAVTGAIRAAATVVSLGGAAALALVATAGAFLWAAERRRRREDLDNERKLAHQDKLALVGTLAAGVGHEIRNHLMVVSAAVRGAQAGRLDPEQLSDAATAVERLASLTRSLGRFGRLDDDQRELVDLADLVAEAVRVVEPRLKHGPKISVTLGRAPVRVGRGPVVQVLVNLLLNAAYAMRERRGEPIEVEAGLEGARAYVRVDDRGPGIAPDVLPRLFQPFVTTKPAGVGTGLGLWISARIARNQGGDLVAGNREGGGARFELDLPAVVEGQGGDATDRRMELIPKENIP